MAKDKKTPRPKTPRPRALPPKGFRDYFGPQVTQRAEMLRKIAEVYERYGFDALESPAVETVEALGSFLPDVDRPNAGIFAFQEPSDAVDPAGALATDGDPASARDPGGDVNSQGDPGSGGFGGGGDPAGGRSAGDWLALRYDLTAPLARVYAQHRNDLPMPYRRYAMGPVWRNEKPGPGRFRQFYQCDADTVGSASMAADAEICAMLADTLEAVGIKRGDYVIRINNRKVLDGILEAINVLDPLDAELHSARRGVVMRAIDKFDRLGLDGVKALLGEGRRDESGDLTQGAKLSEEQINLISDFLGASNEVNKKLIGAQAKATEINLPQNISDHLRAVRDAGDHYARSKLPLSARALSARNRMILKVLSDLAMDSQTGSDGVEELQNISSLLEAQGYGPDRIVIDPSVVRGLGYYTGPVYEAELTFETPDERGRPRAFGSVAGGGRYDDLVKRFTGQAVPATGVSIGVDRLLAALHATGRLSAELAGPVVVTVMDRDRMADYQTMVAELRNAGIRAELYLGNPKSFGNQLKYADKRNSPAAVIQGQDEAARGVVQIKDLILGAKIAETATHAEWKDRPSQIEVPRADLVTEVRRILDGRS